jgi:hypothetical protein
MRPISNFGDSIIPTNGLIYSQVGNMITPVSTESVYYEHPKYNKTELNSVKNKYLSFIKTDPSCILVRLPAKNLCSFYPYIVNGKAPPNGTDSKIFCVDEFTISLRYTFPKNIDLEKIRQTLKIQLFSKNGIILNYDINEIIIKKSENLLILEISAHGVNLLTHAACKEINGRSDGIKNNVNEFGKKQRNLQVSFTDNRLDYFFSCNVLCVANASFNNSLKCYRDDIDQIKNLFSYIQNISNPYVNVQPTTGILYYNQRISEISNIVCLVNLKNFKGKGGFSVQSEEHQHKMLTNSDCSNISIDQSLSNQITVIPNDDEDWSNDTTEPPPKKRKVEKIATSVRSPIEHWDCSYNDPTELSRVCNFQCDMETLDISHDNHDTHLLNSTDTPNMDLSTKLFSHNFEKIKKTHEAIKKIITQSGNPNSDIIMDNVTSIFSIASQYTFESLIQNKPILKL